MPAFDNDELVQDIRDRGNLPPADLRFSSAKLLAAASIELRDVILGMMVNSQTDRAVHVATITLVPGQAEYRLPARAAAGRWQSVALNVPNVGYVTLNQVRPEDYYRQSPTLTGQPTAFFVRDYRVVLVPTPNVALTLRLPYYQRPATLSAASAAGIISAISGNAVTLTTTPPAGFTSTAIYDVVRGSPGFESLAVDRTATVAGSTLTFAAALPSDVVVGDYVTLAGQAPVAQCPVEVRGLLAVRAARRALKAVNEGQQASMLDADVAELTAVAGALLAPRADAAPQEWGSPGLGLLQGLI